MASIRAENIKPWGMSSPSTDSAGVHMRTKAYIDPSNNACMIPREQTRQLENIVDVADEKFSNIDALRSPKRNMYYSSYNNA